MLHTVWSTRKNHTTLPFSVLILTPGKIAEAFRKTGSAFCASVNVKRVYG